ncbi:aminomethyl-transferring glycine dehydrogenase subunit GcvPA [Tuwongella immobilis]|uniref:Probable glycine dehydrogenase (decarboxylating) subunit 1 n=1 Tax=Tuwongella immobilis TaxID=692036 RepID=A0A6C2YN80_9BACT|nr:aminomethyl-transferring glycine dehydrogenase subunit GcvPA [Tuwongella immobilis]VIP02352.1 glycine dehydrogenase subunit 1 : Probable glycine dehydrogenase (decarboxylating) subunit 1 OS=Blastopirellula marina DSM 3645 GN=gcvPA PE=3 SV=1: GDC-P [Tuwongella immobilis]VTS01142.1 glycine dehydrogenase subunit 1 : Probable glycine dehydrogenase (decarboxylating) subunit 1 OS=Blastopirellula marina DSM 3645 GN=gcvPA PE=3 SV=1: GDC-P [Tuwongella immobilis]
MSYLLNTPEDKDAMLASIGVKSIEELFAPIPAELRMHRPLNIPPAMTEIELTSHLAALADRNQAAGSAICFLGGGAYDHFIPSVVDAISGRSEYYTAYTPYQAEASQGSLQAFYEYQTMMANLTGLEVSNASLYEGGSAVAEAVLMATNLVEGRKKVLIAGSVHPEYRKTLQTYAATLDMTVQTLPTPEGFLNPDDLKAAIDSQTACVVLQHPNFFGTLEEARTIGEITKAAGAIFIVSFDPISLGLLERPGDYGADIAIAEGQSLGTPLGYGGPYLGIMTCRNEYVRKIPGRLVGQTVDRTGKRCWVLTLQTREQHIRRDKATSNICTNQGLFALRAAIYLTALGPQGLKETAELCLRKATYAARQLTAIPGISLRFNRPFFKEFSIRVPAKVEPLLITLREQGYLAGLNLGRWYPNLTDSISVAVTEKRTKADIDGLAQAIKHRLESGALAASL